MYTDIIHEYLLCPLQSELGGQLEGAMESTVDGQQWRLEVERVLPSLRIHFRQDNRVS